MPDYESYGIMIKEYSENQIAVIGEWIRKNIRPGRLISEYDSCALKQLLEIDTGICLTNDTVKEAMLLAGFRPECSRDENWRFRILLVREINENPNPFFNWLMGAEYADKSGRPVCAGRFFRAEKLFPPNMSYYGYGKNRKEPVKMTTSKEGFPLKGGEDLLKGLKDLKVKLTENADIVQKYMEAVEKFLPGMTAMLGLTVSDFTLDKKSLIDLRNNMLEGEYSPVVYRAEKDGGKYEAAIWILREACGFSVHFAVVKNKDGQSWMYNSDRQNWEIIKTEIDLSPRMEEILQSGSPESDVLEELLEVFYGDLDDAEYTAIKENNQSLFSLYAETNKYMLPFYDDEEDVMYLIPRDEGRLGFRVGWNGSGYVLYQYLDSLDVLKRNEELGYLEKDHSQAAACTSNLKEMRNCLWMLANRYTEKPVYTVPLSLKAYTESADLREIGKPATFEFEPADRRVLTAEEKKAAEGIRMYVGRLQKGGADV